VGRASHFHEKIKKKRIDSGEQNENSNDCGTHDPRAGCMASGHGTTDRRAARTQPASASSRFTGGFRKTCRSIRVRLLRQNE
jgi:hypothetical protein